MKGIEPSPPAWQAGVLTIELHAHTVLTDAHTVLTDAHTVLTDAHKPILYDILHIYYAEQPIQELNLYPLSQSQMSYH